MFAQVNQNGIDFFVQSRSFLGESGPLDLTLQHMPGSGAYSFAAWQDHILRPRDMDDHLVITARSIDEGARTLIIAVLWLFAGRPTGLKLKELLQEHFPSPRPSVDGPIREETLISLHVSMWVQFYLRITRSINGLFFPVGLVSEKVLATRLLPRQSKS
jgi:hypothetical protein